MSNLQRDLKAIVGVDKIESRLKALEERASIESQRGLAYQNSLGNMVSAATTAASGTTASDTALGSSLSALTDAATSAAEDALENKAKGGGGKKNELDQQGVVNAAIDGVLDIDNFLDGVMDGLNVGDYLLGLSGGAVNGVPTTVRLDKLDANKIVPSGDTSAAGKWTSGVKWTGAFAVSSSAPTAVEAARAASTSKYIIQSFTANPTGSPFPPVSPDRYTVTYLYVTDGLTYTGTVTATSCTVDAEESCPAYWSDSDVPTADLTVYRLQSGAFWVSTPDGRAALGMPIADSEYGPTQLLIVKGSGTPKYVKIIPTSSGGVVVGEVTGPTGTDLAFKTDKRVVVTDANARVLAMPMGSDAANYVNLDISNI